MIKTFNINLAGQIFNINEDAYESMSAYFNSLRRFYKDEADKDEIIRDIEARFAEIFLQKGKNYIITKEEADSVIHMMGMPEEFDGDKKDEQRDTQAETVTAETTIKGKRLYRDADDALVAGVCSGLSAYFGITDPIWMRLLFIISPFITFGTALLIYFILWVVIPEAKTSAQKLAMKGERINLSNIEKTVKDEATKVTGNIHKQTSTGFLSKLVNFIGELVNILFKILIGLIKAIAVIVVASLVIALFAIVFSFIIAAVFGAPVASKIFFENPGDSWLMFLGGTMSGIAVIVFVILAIIHIFSKRTKPLRKGILFPIFGFFMAGLVLLSICINKASDLFSEKRKISQNVPLNYDTLKDTIQLSMANMDKEDINIRMDRFSDFMDYLGKDYVLTPDVEVKIFPADGDSFRVVREYSAYGRDEQEALENASNIEHNITQLNGKMLIDPYFKIINKVKIRNQKLIVKVYVPEGKVIKWNEHVEDFMDEDELPINWDKEAIAAVQGGHPLPPMPPIPPMNNGSTTPPTPPTPPAPPSGSIKIKETTEDGKKVTTIVEKNGKKVEIMEWKDEDGKHTVIKNNGKVVTSVDEGEDGDVETNFGEERNIYGYEHYIFKMVNGELVPLD